MGMMEEGIKTTWPFFLALFVALFAYWLKWLTAISFVAAMIVIVIGIARWAMTTEFHGENADE